MKLLRHIVLFSGILVIVAFFTRISRTALYDGFFSKIGELDVRNSQAWEGVEQVVPDYTLSGVVASGTDWVGSATVLVSALVLPLFLLVLAASLPDVQPHFYRMQYALIPGFSQAP